MLPRRTPAHQATSEGGQGSRGYGHRRSERAAISVVAGQVELRLRVGGREALDFGACRTAAPPRQSALAAAASRERSEQELEQACAAAEAEEAERRESRRLAQRTVMGRSTKDQA